jgi:hypothetical protein
MTAISSATGPGVDFFDTSVRVNNQGRSLTVVFDHPIRQALVIDEVIIVRVEPSPGIVLNENVFGLGREGERLWTIGQLPHVYDDSPYTNISIHADNTVWASNWDGVSCRISPKSGSILEIVAGK